MEETAQSRLGTKMKKSLPPIFDESSLSPRQKKALEIAKAQDVPFQRDLTSLRSDLDPKDVDDLIEAIEEGRKKDRSIPEKNRF